MNSNKLEWASRTGVRSAVGSINGERGAFVAQIKREGSEWRADVYTYGYILTSKTHRTLAGARSSVESSYFVVEGVNL